MTMRPLCACGLLQFITLAACFPHLNATSYHYAKMLQDDLFQNYSTRIRPLVNQSSVIRVSVKFTALAIMDISEIYYKFVINGYLSVEWTDELLSWNPADYGGIDILHPNPADIWKPRVRVPNSHSARDLFEDKHFYTSVDHTGRVQWMPGGVISVSCIMDLTRFPFDDHMCVLVFLITYHNTEELRLEILAEPFFRLEYTENAGWALTRQEHGIVSRIIHDGKKAPGYLAFFYVRRRPAYFIMTIMTPLTVLTILNLLAFVIPVESGAKVCYSVSVMLAYSVSTSGLTTQLPTASENMPRVYFNMFLCFLLAGLVTMDAIFITWLHFKQEETDFENNEQDWKTLKILSKLINIFTFSNRKSAKSLPTRTQDTLDNFPPRSVKLASRDMTVSGIKRKSPAGSNRVAPLSDHAESDQVVDILDQEELGVQDLVGKNLFHRSSKTFCAADSMGHSMDHSTLWVKNATQLTTTGSTAEPEHKESPDDANILPNIEIKDPQSNRYREISRKVNAYSMIIAVILNAAGIIFATVSFMYQV